MRSVVFAFIALATVLSVRPVSAQEAPKADPKSFEHQMALEMKKFEIEQMRAEADFKYQMRQMEIEGKKLELEARRRQIHGDGGGGGGAAAVIAILCLVVHILSTVWVYTDIRQRNSGSGLWVALAMFTGLIGTLVYVIARLGDSRDAAKME